MIDLLQEGDAVRCLAADLDHARRRVREHKVALAEVQEHSLHARQAQEVLQQIAQAVQQRAHDKIAGVVSSCLSTVFDDPYEFKIEFERKRGKTEANLRFVRRGLDVDPLTAAGGGMIDVAAFALRVACLMLHRPPLSRVIVLDEAFRFVSAQYQENVRSMLEGLSKDLGIQIIQVTHNASLVAGSVIEL